MSGTRLVVCAYSEVGHACLELLLGRGEDVVAVYTHADDPGEKVWFPSVSDLARRHGVEVRAPADWRSAAEVEHLRALGPDLLFSFYYRLLLPPSVLSIPRLGAFNMHGSLLPRYRGRAPVNWAVLNGETETGATLHLMAAKADAGDIVDQEAVPIGADDTAGEVQARVTHAAVRILARQIDDLKAGRAPRRPQDESAATTFGRRCPEDGAIHWHRAARDIHNLVRAVSHPYPGAFTDLFGNKTYVWETRLAGSAPPGALPGEVRVEGDAAAPRLLVVCGDGTCLEIRRLQRQGETETSGRDLAPRFLGAPHERNGDA